jgi:hypothetical protein
VNAYANILPNQNLLDIAIQEYGTVEACVAIAFANGKSITEDLIPGQELKLPADAPANTDIQKYYSQSHLKPATANIDAALETIIVDGELTEIIQDTPLQFAEEFENEFLIF